MSKLWYEQPAGIWEEALPLGNGRLGAMVFGRIANEQIQVNEESMWLGGRVNRINPDFRENLPRVRELLDRGEISKAECRDVPRACILIRHWAIFCFSFGKSMRNRSAIIREN